MKEPKKIRKMKGREKKQRKVLKSERESFLAPKVHILLAPKACNWEAVRERRFFGFPRSHFVREPKKGGNGA